ncbi:hypothetical protein D3C84_401660 [compost metagenome]
MLAVGHRQHRNVSLGVFLFAVDGQRPEVRWGPGEDDQHQQQPLGIQLAGHRGPAEQRRRRAGQAADDDVLRRGALEKAGVQGSVTEQRGQGQPGGQRVGEGQQQRLTGQRQDQGEGQRRARRDAPGHQRAQAGARHDRVDAAVHHVVDRRRRAGAQADAEVAEQQHRPRHAAVGGEEHADQRSDKHQHHHLGFGQFQIIAPAGVGLALLHQSGHGVPSPRCCSSVAARYDREYSRTSSPPRPIRRSPASCLASSGARSR